MKFDKNKILTCVTADQANVGMNGWVADTLSVLMRRVKECHPTTIAVITGESMEKRFVTDANVYALFYPAPEPSYRPFNDDELNDLVGKVLTNKYTGYNKLVTERVANIAVRVGDSDCTAKDLFHSFTLGGNPCGVKEEV